MTITPLDNRLDPQACEPYDLPHEENRAEIRSGTLVIGGGAAGTLAAIHLLEIGEAPVVLIERTAPLGRGTAYRTEDPAHLLNVPAGRLSVSSRHPGAFVDWLTERHPTAGAATFAPRGLYGEYLAESLLAAAFASGSLRVVSDEAVSLSLDGPGRAGERVRVRLAGGGRVSGARAILALGAPPPADPLHGQGGSQQIDRYISDPWAPGALDPIAGEDVILIGSGLTAVDVVLSLSRRPRRIRLVSRHGLLPHAHAPAAPPLQAVVEGRHGPARLLRALRAAAAEGNDWRSIVDGLRPSTQRLWHDLGPNGQAQALRHGAPFWNVHRHRMAPETAARIDELLRSGALAVRAGRVDRITEREQALEVQMVLRGTGETVTERSGYLINCTGPRLRLFDDPPALVRDLVRQGLARPDSHGIGLDTTGLGGLLDGAGNASVKLFALGALRRGTLWESTAIPELRAQAEALAAGIRSDVSRSRAVVAGELRAADAS
jgi:uncharacterized NAD(P)/FAD-binding protein YdhS